MIKPAQLRAARGLIGWTREQLRDASGVSVETIKNIEHGRFKPTSETAGKIRLTFIDEGVGFFGVLARHPIFGVVLQPLDVTPQDHTTEASSTKQERHRLILRMAVVIAESIREYGQCSPSELEDKGFTREEIAAAWSFASALADVELMEPDE
jgi:transcriptional regulator with XRE-family HTH domain